MNVLFWAFLAGTSAVVFPFVFHLIRRTPKGRQAFSSLMFLKPSPPRLTRRSRLDDLLLLFLRALVLVLLAFAFMRPLWRMAADLSIQGVRGRRVAILVDTSASMRRGDLWNQAVAKVEEALDELEPADEVALFSFDQSVQTLVGFGDQQDAEQNHNPSLIRRRLKELSPTWAMTDLGAALIRAAEVLDETTDREETDAALQIIVVSDLQRGSQLEALQAYEWPTDVRVAIQQVALNDPTNASLQLLARANEEDAPDEPRVRVTNSAESMVDQFRVGWTNNAAPPGEDAVPFYVPPGQSRVLRVPRGPRTLTADRLVLSGDPADFDNVYHVVPIRQKEFRLTYLGDDASHDPEGLLFYLERALEETPARKVVFSAQPADTTLPLLAGELPRLIVVTRAVSEDQREALDRYVESGGKLLVVLNDQEMAKSLGDLLGGAEIDSPSTTEQGDYLALGEIDFTHPLFLPFASPRYNDFTGIRFWKARAVTLPADSSAHVIARFDNGKPALWEQPRGKGTLYLLASGWQPEESQLALSNKFLPLMEELLEQCTPRRLPSSSYLIREAVPLPASSAKTPRMVKRPDGGEVLIASEASFFDETNEPGIYLLKANEEVYPFAVNLSARESDTRPLDVEQLEQFRIQLGTQSTRSEEYERLRQLRDVELESRQKLWKWLIGAALVLVGWETWLAGSRARKPADVSGDLA